MQLAQPEPTIFCSKAIQSREELISDLAAFVSSIKVNQVNWRSIYLWLNCTSGGLSVLNVKQPVELEPFCSLLKSFNLALRFCWHCAFNCKFYWALPNTVLPLSFTQEKKVSQILEIFKPSCKGKHPSDQDLSWERTLGNITQSL